LLSLLQLPEPKKKDTSLKIGIYIFITLKIGIYIFIKIKNADVIEAWELEVWPHWDT